MVLLGFYGAFEILTGPQDLKVPAFLFGGESVNGASKGFLGFFQPKKKAFRRVFLDAYFMLPWTPNAASAEGSTCFKL